MRGVGAGGCTVGDDGGAASDRAASALSSMGRQVREIRKVPLLDSLHAGYKGWGLSPVDILVTLAARA
jgi:hypothetical protein